LAAVVGMVVVLKRDVQRPYYGPERDPVLVARSLDSAAAELGTYYYFDPQQPHGSLFANIAGLDHAMTAPPALDDVRKMPRVLLPAAEDPTILGPDVVVEPFGAS
jgi:hypothetical protein